MLQELLLLIRQLGVAPASLHSRPDRVLLRAAAPPGRPAPPQEHANRLFIGLRARSARHKCQHAFYRWKLVSARGCQGRAAEARAVRLVQILLCKLLQKAVQAWQRRAQRGRSLRYKCATVLVRRRRAVAGSLFAALRLICVVERRLRLTMHRAVARTRTKLALARLESNRHASARVEEEARTGRSRC